MIGARVAVTPVSPAPTFRGVSLSVFEAVAAPPRSAVAGLCVTGHHVWPSTLAALRHLEALDLPSGGSYLDLSAGTGLLSLALAVAAGPTGDVTATELPSSLSLLAANAAAAPAGAAPIHVRAHAWGAPLPLPPAAPARGLYLAVVCDVLHCALRDGTEDALAATLAEAALAAEAGALVVWEVRSGAAERALLARAAARAGGALVVGVPAQLSVAGLLGRGVGHPEGELWLPPSLFPEAEEVGDEAPGAREVLACTLHRCAA